ncbi:MAG: group 1 truncated hemoglobin [Bryobacteraceae bacterium]
MSTPTTLYARLGGYDAISAVSIHLVGRLMADPRLGRFWAHRGTDGLQRELQLLVNFLCHATGGPMLYTGRDMKTSHKGMRIDEGDWQAFLGHLNATLDHFGLTGDDRAAVAGFVESTKAEIVEA